MTEPTSELGRLTLKSIQKMDAYAGLALAESVLGHTADWLKEQGHDIPVARTLDEYFGGVTNMTGQYYIYDNDHVLIFPRIEAAKAYINRRKEQTVLYKPHSPQINHEEC